MKSMANHDKARVLCSLAHYAIDGFHHIDKAAHHIRNQRIKKKLHSFTKECEESVHDLSELIHQKGGDAPLYSKDFQGFFMQGYVPLQSVDLKINKQKNILTTLYTNLHMVVNVFQIALEADFSGRAKNKLQLIYEKSDQHLKYLRSLL